LISLSVGGLELTPEVLVFLGTRAVLVRVSGERRAEGEERPETIAIMLTTAVGASTQIAASKNHSTLGRFGGCCGRLGGMINGGNTLQAIVRRELPLEPYVATLEGELCEIDHDFIPARLVIRTPQSTFARARLLESGPLFAQRVADQLRVPREIRPL
jgi:hypothetical protein